MTLSIWVDADACPKPAKEILYRAAKRTQTMVTLVANQALPVPQSPYIRAIQVSSGYDVADNYIVHHAQGMDLVITSDIPLAAELIPNKVKVITPRGDEFTTENIRQRLQMRDFMETLRSSGQHTGGPAAYDQTDRQNFANTLDKILSKAGTDNQ